MNPPLVFLSLSKGYWGGRHYGGGEHFASEFLKAMAGRGWRVTLVCPPECPLLEEPALVNALESVERLDLSSGLRQPRAFLAAMRRWVAFGLRRRDAIFYGNGMVTLKWLTPLCLLGRIDAVCHLHESTYEYYDTLRTRLQSPLMRRFIAISAAVRDLYARGSRTAPEKIELVHNGVPIAPEVDKSPAEATATRLRLGLPADVPLICMVARTNAEKGHAVLLRAVRPVLAEFPQAIFAVVGMERTEGAEAVVYDQLRQILQEEGIEASVRCLPHTPEARAIMRVSDLAVVPSTSEGFGRTAIEAMGEQTALIASKVGGLAEIVTDEVDGLHFPVGDSARLADCIRRLLRNPAERARLAVAGHRTARERFSLEGMVGRIEAVLRDVRKKP